MSHDVVMLWGQRGGLNFVYNLKGSSFQWTNDRGENHRPLMFDETY